MSRRVHVHLQVNKMFGLGTAYTNTLGICHNGVYQSLLDYQVCLVSYSLHFCDKQPLTMPTSLLSNLGETLIFRGLKQGKFVKFTKVTEEGYFSLKRMSPQLTELKKLLHQEQ